MQNQIPKRNPEELPEMERIIVSGIITSSDGKILMGQKDPAKGGVYSDGYWHIPGGGSEEGETPEETLKREIWEEAELDIEDGAISILDNKGEAETEKTLAETGARVWCKMKFIVYSVKLSSDSQSIIVNPTEELPILMWIDPRDLKDMQLTPPSVELFTRLGYLD